MSAHQLLRLTASLYNRPHLADKETFEAVVNYLEARNAGLLSFNNDKPATRNKFDSSNSIGVIQIHGPLQYRSSGWEGLCGGYSYESLLQDASEMLNAGVKTIVMDCDSGGGEAYGCFESSEELRAMVDDAGASLFAYVDGSACSAMYGLACVADEVIANPYAEVGSIGVLIGLTDRSEQMKQEGIKKVWITDGTEKVPFDASGGFKESFLDDLRIRVAELGDSFRSHVSKHTGLSVEDIKATNAKVFSAEKALQIGLINKIMTRSEFISYVSDKHKGLI